MKKAFVCIVTSFILVLSLNQLAFCAGEDVKVYLDGTELSFTDALPQIVNDRTMVPMRAIFEAIGATVKWDDSTKSVIAIAGDSLIALTIGSDTAIINGEEKDLDTAPFIFGSRTYVPLRFIGEGTGASVEWDNDARSVIITTAIQPDAAAN